MPAQAASMLPSATLFLPSPPSGGLRSLSRVLSGLMRELGLPVRTEADQGRGILRVETTSGPEVLLTFCPAPMNSEFTESCARPRDGAASDVDAIRCLEDHRATLAITVLDPRMAADDRTRHVQALALRLARGLIDKTGARLVLWAPTRVLYTAGEFLTLGRTAARPAQDASTDDRPVAALAGLARQAANSAGRPAGTLAGAQARALTGAQTADAAPLFPDWTGDEDSGAAFAGLVAAGSSQGYGPEVSGLDEAGQTRTDRSADTATGAETLTARPRRPAASAAPKSPRPPRQARGAEAGADNRELPQDHTGAGPVSPVETHRPGPQASAGPHSPQDGGRRAFSQDTNGTRPEPIPPAQPRPQSRSASQPGKLAAGLAALELRARLWLDPFARLLDLGRDEAGRPKLGLQIAVYLLNIGVLMLSFPAGMALLVYNIIKGEAPRATLATLVLVGIGAALGLTGRLEAMLAGLAG